MEDLTLYTTYYSDVNYASGMILENTIAKKYEKEEMKWFVSLL